MREEWHFIRNGRERGPMTAEQLQDLARSGELRPDDLVWTESMPQWKPAGEISSHFFVSPLTPPTFRDSTPGAADRPATLPLLPIQVSDHALRLLQQTRPWLRFVGIVSILAGAVMSLVGLLLILLLFIAASEELAELAGKAMTHLAAAIASLAIGFAVIRYASSIRIVLEHPESVHLEEAMAEQKRCWQVIGGSVLIAVALIALALALLLTASVILALS